MEHPAARRILKRRQAPRGFTLVEMLIVLVIIVIISGIIFSGQLNFDRTVTLNNTAYDIALLMRQAQSYGLSSKVFGGVANTGYGVSFQSAQPTSYVFFADTSPTALTNCGGLLKPNCKPGDGIYQSAAVPTETVQTYTLNNGFTISAFCTYSSTYGKVCTGAGLTSLSISFIRPNSETTIEGFNASWYPFTRACIRLAAPTGDTRYVVVSVTGQIQVGSKSVVDNSNTVCP